jgi:hypothetical protein
MQVAHDPRCAKSGVYWSWNGGPREGRGAEALEKGGQISGGGGAGGGWDSIFENDQSAKVLDVEAAMKLYQYSTQITGAEWPDIKAINSPCPTLKVIGAVTKGMVQREELKRMREMGRPGMGTDAAATVITMGTPAAAAAAAVVVKPSTKKKVILATDRVVSGVLSNTVGRVARFAGKRLLGEFPEEAVTGSFHEGQPALELQRLDLAQELLEQEVAPQLAAPHVDKEDEALFREIYNTETGTTVNGARNKTTVGV